MLGIFLIIQIISGLFLSIHYCPNINIAFYRISNIIKDINSGWLIGWMVLIIYFHIARNLFCYSFKLIQV